MKKTIILSVLLTSALITQASAEVLGTVSGGYTNDMGAYSVFHKTEFEDSNVGKQTEYYVEYTPNTDAVPVIADDGSQWGQSDINTVLGSYGSRVVAGINADYFSFKTGLPMGSTISGGELVSAVDEEQPAIGFRDDGTAFIDDLKISMKAYSGEKNTDIVCLNKWYQSGYDPIFMLTDKFGETTKTNGNCIFVIFSKTDGVLKIGSDLELRVDEKFEYSGEIKIPKDKIIFVIDKDFGKPEPMDFINSLNIGDSVTIKTQAVNSEKNLWSEAVEGTSSLGGRLLKNGEIGSGFEAGTAPRTAVGIKENGNVIMYTLDGRQKNYSYGATINTLAQRMKELGCVDAINLDGGGSTVMGALLGGTDNFGVMNSPSEGSLRRVANYIFLKDNRKPTGIPWIVNIEPINDVYYLGDAIEIKIESVYDTNNYKTDASAVKITADNAQADGTHISFDKMGEVVIGVGDSKYKTTVHRRYFSDIDSHWAKDKIVEMSDMDIVSGTGNYMFNPDNNMTRAEFAMIVSRFNKADFSEYENVNLPFADVDEIPEWALAAVKTAYGSGFMNGKSNDGGATLYFDPNSAVTRAEAMTMLNRILNIEDYSETAFADDDEIPDWARDGITRLVSSGIVRGYSDNTIKPNNKITRAEGTSMLYGAVNLK